MSIEVRNQTYYFEPMEEIITGAYANLKDIQTAMRKAGSKPNGKTYTMTVKSSRTRSWFYNPLHDLESIFWILARQVLYQDHYLQRLNGFSANIVTVPIGDDLVRFPPAEDSRDRVCRIKAYFALGHGLFISRAHRQAFLQSNKQLSGHLIAYPLLPAVRPLGVALTKMRNDIVKEYIKWEADLDNIDYRCAEQLHVMFANALKCAYDALSVVEDGNYEIMSRSLQSEMAMIRDQEATEAANRAPSTNTTSEVTSSSKRSRDDTDDTGEDAILHPSKSPRTEANRSPHQQSVEAIDSSSPVVAPSLPAFPPPIPAPVVIPKAGPKRKARVIPLPTRTLRSHTLRTLKTESAPEPPILSLPPSSAPVRGRKTASRVARGRGKATKNNEAVRAAAKVAAKVKNTTRKGR